MKKIVAVMLLLLLCMGAALAEQVEITGTWYLNEIGEGDVFLHPSAIGKEMSLTFNEDHTAVMDESGTQANGSWDLQDGRVVLTFADSSLYFDIKGNDMVMQVDTVSMIFGKEKLSSEVMMFAPGAINAEAAMEDYNGTWNAVLADMLGMQLPVADMGMTMQITVEDGNITVLNGQGEEASEAHGAAVVQNGTLIVLVDGDTEAVPFQLHESGLMSMRTDIGGGLIMGIYFEKLAE